MKKAEREHVVAEAIAWILERPGESDHAPAA